MNLFTFRFCCLIILFLGITSTLFAQPSKTDTMQNYLNEWKEIEKLEYDGLTKSALEKTQTLYDKIQKDNKNPLQTAQSIKALIYLNTYQGRLEEDGLVKCIYRFREAAEKAESPQKPLLYSMLAEMYDQYLNHHLYKFRDRTATDNFELEDIRTWSVERITEETYRLYTESLKYNDTKNIPISDFQPITRNGNKNAEALHPTLYDFLVHRAIQFFRSEKRYLTQPAYKFYIDDLNAISNAKTFINHTFEAKDSLSTKFQTLLLFQQLLAFHQNDKDPQAFIYSELLRLDYVRDKAIIPNKDSLYYEQLEKLAEQFKDHDAVAEVWHKIATYHYDRGNSYRPSPLQTYRWELKKALEICNTTIEKYPKSYGASHAAALITQIKSKDLQIELERIYPIEEELLGALSYKNVTEAHFKVIALSDNQLNKYNETYNESRIQFLNKQKPLHEWTLNLPDEGDFQNHKLEFKIPALENGRYVIVASEAKDFKYKENGQAIAFFNVSNISYSARQIKGIYEYYVNHRKTGQPQKGVTVNFFEHKYNSLFRKYEWRKVDSGKTDENGWIQTKVKQNNGYYSRSYRLEFITANDALKLDDSYYNYKNEVSDVTDYTTHFFLDRAIYRPGQTVYFKGIITKVNRKNPKDPQIAKNYSSTIYFYDANSQEIAKMEVQTNEFGSFQGSFVAPASGLTGQMRLYNSSTSSNKYFRVEEYKRPKFEVSFKPVKGSFKLGEQVQVTGLAEAYAGNAIDGAKVSYRVVRKAEFPYWRWWRWGWYNPFSQQQQEIKFGEMETDENGEFIIEFDAIPDKSIPVERQPQFRYTVYADVIDITGETHSSSVVCNVGYVALNLSMYISDNLKKSKENKLEINSRNLNGQFEPASGQIKIEQLATPDQVYNNRYWERPDYHVLKAEEFKKSFPQYAFDREDEIQNWEITKEVLSQKFDTEKEDELKFATDSWEQGKYKLTISSKDKFGTAVERVYYFTLYDESSKTTPLNEALFLSQQNFYNVEPDTTIQIQIGAHNTAAWLLFEVEFEDKIVQRKWMQPEGKTSIPIQIEEKHRGNLSFHVSTTQNNRFYTDGGTIYVPWSNKQLEIEYSTFRDKLLPGQKEEWTIKIKGQGKEKVAAEVLAGMYDASLDAFAANYWSLYLYPSSYRSRTLSAYQNFRIQNSDLVQNYWYERSYGQGRTLPTLNWFIFSFYEYAFAEGNTVVRTMGGKGGKRRSKKKASPGAPMKEEAKVAADEMPMSEISEEESLDSDIDGLVDAKDDLEQDQTKGPKEDQGKDENFDDVKVRTNLNETVFFFPELKTDEDGNVLISFTMNEALTKWKFMTLAHTQDLKTVTQNKEVVTQKDLMILPNPPRFLRQSDVIHFTAKVSNLTEEKLQGQAILQLFDAITMESVDLSFANKDARINFEVEGKRSTPLSWKLEIPADWSNTITYRVIAKAGNFSDGEENTLPVLSNRMLVTETMPLPVRGGESKKFEFKRMAEVSKSNTMKHQQFTLEFTQNPAWYAVQALPYLMEFPHECTEQIFSRYYANSLATSVANAHPKIKRVFEQWKNIDTDALKSNLSKNQELKYALLEETPWVLNAQSEEQQKKNIGLLFDLNRMSDELTRAADKMIKRQMGGGGFPWFPGGRPSWYITQYITEGMGHLDVLGVKAVREDNKVYNMVKNAVGYCDHELAEMYKNLLKAAERSEDPNYLKLDHLNSMAIHYLYTRSFWLDIPVTNKKTKEAIAYYEEQAITFWRNKSMYMKGLLALGLHRKGEDKETPAKIVANLKENALNSEEMGMYWKYPSGYFWYQAPIETHALMIEVFDEIPKDEKAVEDLKVWLLKNKQTSHWKTTKATAAAVYALLRRGDNWLLDDQEIEIKLGGEVLDQSNIKKEAGTGYFKTKWAADEIKAEMANIEVTNPNKVVAWGAVYWQYFEQLDKITHFKETPLSINKQLFKEVNTDRGPRLEPITDKNVKLEPGDLLKVRIEIRVDRDMEYVHMKDHRASGFEPVNVLSQYKYQGGLGYYESTKDMATHFFFSYLSKGTYVFEYPLRVNHKGDFSNGITTIQCMYAPEFTSHSEGVRVEVD